MVRIVLTRRSKVPIAAGSSTIARELAAAETMTGWRLVQHLPFDACCTGGVSGRSNRALGSEHHNSDPHLADPSKACYPVVLGLTRSLNAEVGAPQAVAVDDEKWMAAGPCTQSNRAAALAVWEATFGSGACSCSLTRLVAEYRLSLQTEMLVSLFACAGLKELGAYLSSKPDLPGSERELAANMARCSSSSAVDFAGRAQGSAAADWSLWHGATALLDWWAPRSPPASPVELGKWWQAARAAGSRCFAGS